ncbi:AmmeMemoRadiSam system protein A [Olsenella sp. HMSC062G07]|uniref:AmmeMemoRadiSam system protein A n=1 Tax=Olsenella sp. HMSC062G07 TaxID=1739330 RepID=UPI0008A2E4AF|nr:AmmeMemoRadiSam system protein A [Olsenella sp. HMSC062G07]OFK25278.1 extradiol ring-cleavage dioxygenase [Olsenella sp. HMSC062G07]
MAILAACAVPHPPLIVPQVGRGRERDISRTVSACREVAARIVELAPQTIVISSPHAPCYRDYVHIAPGTGARGSFAEFGAPEARYSVRYDEPFAQALAAAARKDGIDAGGAGERDPSLDHATMVPLHFIEEAYRHAGRNEDVRVVRMGLSGLSPQGHYRLGRLVQRVAAALGRGVVMVASGDLSHKLAPDGPYGFAPEGPVFDRRVCDAFASGDLLPLLAMDRRLALRAAECGLRSFQIMAGTLDRTPRRSRLLSYEGPFGVGYGVALLEPTGPEGSDERCALLPRYESLRAERLREARGTEDPYVRLARRAVEAYVREGRRLTCEDGANGGGAPLPQISGERAGCFVSLSLDGELRGCMGTIAPTQPTLADEICSNAVSACARDPRFEPVRVEELDELVYDVDVLQRPEAVSDMDQLDARRYGVIVSCEDGRRGLLLPDLDGVDGVGEQVRIAARKGGIDLERDDWRLQRFEVVRHR